MRCVRCSSGYDGTSYIRSCDGTLLALVAAIDARFEGANNTCARIIRYSDSYMKKHRTR